jgi:hypothetical protein
MIAPSSSLRERCSSAMRRMTTARSAGEVAAQVTAEDAARATAY